MKRGEPMPSQDSSSKNENSRTTSANIVSNESTGIWNNSKQKQKYNTYNKSLIGKGQQLILEDQIPKISHN